MTALQVHIRSAGYDTKRDVIREVAFTVEAGQLVGLIGANGAGKSTTIKAMMGLLDHVDADVQFGAERDGSAQRYSYIPEQPLLYDGLTLWEHLELAAVSYEMEEETFRQRAEAMLARFRLHHVKHQLPSTFSKGMQQKMMLVIGFLLQPDVYIVDEPFVGLDPLATKQFLDFIDMERSRGAAILMSTHVLDTAEHRCDSFLIVHKGRLVAKGTLPSIREQCGQPPDATLFDCFLSIAGDDDLSAEEKRQ